MRFRTFVKLISLKHFQKSISLGFVVLMILILVIAVVSYYNLSSMGSRLAEVVGENNEKTSLIYSLRGLANKRLILLHRIVHETDPFVIDDQVIKHQRLAGTFIKLRSKLSAKISNNSEVHEMSILNDVVKIAYPAQTKVIELVQGHDSEFTIDALDTAIFSQQRVVEQLEKFAEMQKQFTHSLMAKSEHEFEFSFYLLTLITIVVLLLAAATSWFVMRIIIIQSNDLLSTNAELEASNLLLVNETNKSIRANKSQSEFIANMSHEFRTPMTSIRGALGMLNAGMIENIPSDALKMISIADTNSERLMDLISDVLNFSKIEAGELELIRREFIIKDEMEKMLVPYVAKVKQKGLQLKVNYDQNLPEVLVGDLEHLRHIIIQLLNNAIKFTEKGYVKINIGCSIESDELNVSISDTGIGITDKDITHLFENFVQGDGSSTRKYGGTGIGLAICKRLIVALEGDIGARTVIGEGSTFWFTLPVAMLQKAA